MEKIVFCPDMNDKSYGYYIEKDNKSTYYKYTNTTVIMVEHTYRLSNDIEEDTYCKAFIYTLKMAMLRLKNRDIS